MQMTQRTLPQIFVVNRILIFASVLFVSYQISFGLEIARFPLHCKLGFVQQDEPPNKGAAAPVGDVGRLDLRVVDENGHPIGGAYAVFTSKQLVGRKKGGVCESWDYTNQRGYVVLPPLQIGEISLMVYKKGYKRAYLGLQPNELANRVVVKLKK